MMSHGSATKPKPLKTVLNERQMFCQVLYLNKVALVLLMPQRSFFRTGAVGVS